MNAVRKLLRNENDYNFVRAWRIGLIVSAVLMMRRRVLALSTRGLNWGIDFEGGTSWELPANGAVGERGPRRDAALRPGRAQPIQTVGGDTLRVRSEATSEEDAGKIRDALADGGRDRARRRRRHRRWARPGARRSPTRRIRALIFFFVVVGPLHHLDAARVAHGASARSPPCSTTS